MAFPRIYAHEVMIGDTCYHGNMGGCGYVYLGCLVENYKTYFRWKVPGDSIEYKDVGWGEWYLVRRAKYPTNPEVRV